jgi:hypothetical protein
MGYNIGSRITYRATDGLIYIATVIDYNFNSSSQYLVQVDGYSGEIWIAESAITGSA